MKTLDAKSNTYIEFNEENNKESPKLEFEEPLKVQWVTSNWHF